jgi:hypothetical protein
MSEEESLAPIRQGVRECIPNQPLCESDHVDSIFSIVAIHAHRSNGPVCRHHQVKAHRELAPLYCPGSSACAHKRAVRLKLRAAFATALVLR